MLNQHDELPELRVFLVNDLTQALSKMIENEIRVPTGRIIVSIGSD